MNSFPFRTRRPRPVVTVAAAAVTASFISSLGADVSVNNWVSNNWFHHARVGVPDQDQRRVGLPNGGNCFCVPTSTMNMLIYMANHGYPEVTPGPGNYSGYEHYYTVTNLLDDLGAWVNISPGGADPNDPDCDDNDSGGVAGDGSDGECGTLPCGTSFTSVYNALMNHNWLGGATNDLVWTARFLDDNAPPPRFVNIAKLGYQGNIVSFAYGRYKPVGTIQGGIPVYKRSGGHAVTMNQAFRQDGTQRLYSRDPAQDDGDPFGPSPYVSKQYDVSTTLTLKTGQEEAPFNDVELKILDGLDEPHADGVRRLIDGYIAVKPKSGVFWNNYGVIHNLPLTIGFGGFGGGTIQPIPLFSVSDLVLDQDQTGWFVLTGSDRVTVAMLRHIDAVSGVVTPLLPTEADRLATSRFGDIYTIEFGSPLLRRFRLKPDADLEPELEPQSVMTLPTPPAAIMYDDATDRVLVLRANTSGFGGTLMLIPRLLDAAEPTISYLVPTSVPLGGQMRLAMNPADGLVWISSQSAGKAFGLAKPSAPGGTMSVTESVEGFANLTCVEFDDGGTLYAVDGTFVKVFTKSPTGGLWIGAPAGALEGIEVGEALRLARSRTNFDPAVHDTEEWRNITAEELVGVEDIGTLVPDCLGDLNGDGNVDGADLGLLLASWGAVAPNTLADLDQDGAVDGADLGLLLAAWGNCP